MLILTRRIGETVIIGDNISLTILTVRGNQVRLGINAPKSVPVHRKEIYDRIQSGQPHQDDNNEISEHSVGNTIVNKNGSDPATGDKQTASESEHTEPTQIVQDHELEPNMPEGSVDDSIGNRIKQPKSSNNKKTRQRRPKSSSDNPWSS